MIENYQEEQALEERETQDASFATIDAVFDDGLTLRFDGQEEASEKHYKCNAFCIFHPGDRVRVIKDAKTYVVEYPVGNPRRTFAADTAEHAATADAAQEAAHAETAGSAERATHADSASSAQSANTANSANTAATANTASLALRVGSNASTSTYIWLMVNSNGYFISSNYNSTWLRIATS